MAQASRPIQVAAIGMDERMKNTLRLFFQGPCKNRCVLVEEESAETSIIDLDGYQGQTLCDEYRKRHPDQPIILISLHENQAKNAIVLRKPLKAKELLLALSKTQRSLPTRPKQPVAIEQTVSDVPKQETALKPPISDPSDSETTQRQPNREPAKAPSTHHAARYLEDQDSKILIGTVPDIDPDDVQQRGNAQYQPEEFLQSHLARAFQRADEKNRSVTIETPRGSIYLLPHGQWVVMELSDSQLRTLSVIPIADSGVSLRVLESDNPVEQEHTESTISRDALLWKTSLWASRGRVPADTNLDTPVFLRRWPNLTRLPLFPHALRIAALWSNQPHSLLDTAKVLGIPQRHVFGFYSAAHALGLAATGRRAADSLIEPPPPQKNRYQGLFGRILKHLRKSKGQ